MRRVPGAQHELSRRARRADRRRRRVAAAPTAPIGREAVAAAARPTLRRRAGQAAAAAAPAAAREAARVTSRAVGSRRSSTSQTKDPESRGRRPQPQITTRRHRAGRAARDDGRVGHPPGARGRADGRLPARGDRGPRARRLRGHRARHGRRRELQQRLGGARQARLGLRLRRPPRVRPPHRRLGRLGDRLEGRRGRHALEARRRGRHPLQPGLLRGPRGPRPRSARRAVSQKIWGYETTWGSFAQFTKVQAQQLLPKPKAPRLGGGRVLRPDVLHRLPDADGPREAAGRPQGADLGRRRRPRRVRHPALRAAGRRLRRRRLLATRRASSSSSSAPTTTSTATSSRA